MHSNAAACSLSNAPWFVLRTSYRGEALARSSLIGLLATAQLDFSVSEEELVWLPQERRLENRSARRVPVSVMRPLIPGYILVRLNEWMRMNLYHAIATARGVAGFLRIGECDAIVRHEEELQRFERAANCAQSEPQGDQLAPGDGVRVTGGLLEGYDGIVRRLDRETRVVLLMQCLGPATPVTLDRSQVERL